MMLNFADAVRKMSKASFLIGESEDGELICASISKNPHLFISGVTGTGKSVFLHSVLLSLMFQNRPENLRFILCDSKMVEMAQYNGMSHLLTPVITDPKRIKGMLIWANQEIYRRLNEFVKLNKKTLQDYNDYLWENFLSENGLPRVIIVIDDISDISMQSADIWDPIKQIILKGRTVGVHLLLVTQAISQKRVREIAKMIPSKLVFLTLTQQDSKFLIGNTSACQLETPGNAIFSDAPGHTLFVKTFMANRKIEKIILSSIQRFEAKYDQSVMKSIEEKSFPNITVSFEKDDEFDELFLEAVDIVLECGQASVSVLQRKLNLGYSRAAKLIDQMEQANIVGPFQGSIPRKILATKADWKKRKSDIVCKKKA